MAIASQPLAAGPGWRVTDVTCTSGPDDRPFEEHHHSISVSAVVEGTFHYRCAHGHAFLAPGAVLLGNAGDCFECSHEHGAGDRCVAFHYTPAFWESVVAAVPGARRADFRVASLPPTDAMLPVLANAQAARDDGDELALEEAALRIAGAAVTLAANAKPATRAPSRRDERRIAAAVRRIEAGAESPLTLGALAAISAMSPFHFLRTFRQVVGTTPHQHVLRSRMQRAALALRRTAEPVTSVALAAGFEDLSTFNRRFRRVMGMSPVAYRNDAR